MAQPTDTVLALDFGAARVGVAMTTIGARLPSPLTTLTNSPSLIDEIIALIASHGAIALVIGYPRNLAGEPTAQTRLVEAFSDQLKERVDIPVYLIDEALTSVKAENRLKAERKAYNKGDIDALAASYILEDFFNEHPEFTL